MGQAVKTIDRSWSITRSVYMWTNILNTPFWAIFNMLPFILYKDLHATPLQVTLIITLKPLVSLFSLYWSAHINKRRDRLLSNMIWARVLGHLPFFFFPFIDNVWFYIASFGFYMTLARGVVPAWMEILKLNIPEISREKVFAAGSLMGYIGNAIFPFLIGWLLDDYFQAWRWLFPIAACISLAAAFFKAKIPIPADVSIDLSNEVPQSWQQQLTAPWKNAWDLLCRRPDFLKFQWGFMLGGAGVMIMQPALPQFFVDGLQLSYMEMSVALTFCKGIGFALTTPVWARYLHKIDIFRFSALPPLCLCLFSVCLLSAQTSIFWLYAAYICYGVMQAGSEMCWHLSGPIFSKKEDSSTFSSVNVLTVGLRGCIVPPLGSLIAYSISSPFVIAVGGVLCLLSNLRLYSYSPKRGIQDSDPLNRST